MALVPEPSRGTAGKQLDTAPTSLGSQHLASEMPKTRAPLGPHVEKQPQGAVGAPAAFPGTTPPPPTPLGPLSRAKSQLVSITPAPGQNCFPDCTGGTRRPHWPHLTSPSVHSAPRASVPESTSPGRRAGQAVALLCQTPGGSMGSWGWGWGQGPRPCCGHTCTHMCVHPQVCMPVASWLLMTAAFLPCSAKPWQTGKKKGSLSLQRAEIFHHEIAHLCNKKGKMFKPSIPRNCLSQGVWEIPATFGPRVGQAGPAIASPGGSMGLLGVDRCHHHPPFLCRFHHWGWAASGVGVLDLEEWSPESAPGFQGVGGPQGGRPPTQPPNTELRDPGLLLQDSRTPAPASPYPGSRAAQGHTACSGLSASPPSLASG